MIITELFFTFFIIISLFVINDYYKNKYDELIIENDKRIINNILNKHPELREEIGSIILNKDLVHDYTKDMNFLNNYKNDISYKYNKILISLIILYLIFTFIFYIIFVLIQKNKIKNIRNYIYNILNDDYSLDIKDYKEGYLSELKNDIYKVTTKLKKMLSESTKNKKYLEEALSDISHQIKTPLTSMRLINELLSENNLSEVDRKKFLNRNLDQLVRLEWLVTSLLKISKLDSGTVKLESKKVNVKELLDKSLDTFKILFELKNIDIKINVKNNVIFMGDFNWSREAIVNIIKNAYEHSKENSIIQINAETNPLFVQIKITDHGEGIDKEVIGKIFERFYKGNTNKESVGIGLNMSRLIIEKQAGDISVESIKGDHTTFTIKFYKR